MACNILSIDGGGTRGIVPATIINCIEKETGHKIMDFFDVVAGTSTGGIIATAMAAGVDSAELVNLYLNKAKDIFKQTFFDRLSGVDEYLEADYSNKGLKKELDRILGSSTLKDLQNGSFGKAGKHLMICSFDLNPEPSSDGNLNYRPDVFYSGYIRDAQRTLSDICLMTSAAPTYFPIYMNHIDGGVAMNNPSMAAVAFALNDHVSEKPDYLYPDGFNKGLANNYKNLKLVSLGTGTSNKTFITEAQVKKGNWGKLKWINYLPDLLTEGNVQSTHYYVDQVLVSKNYVRWNPCFDSETAPEILRNEGVKMDEKDKNKLQAMSDYAKTYYEAHKKEILKLIGA
jgi:patatin-like phospholipase/acyl hydrolase